MTSTTRSQSGTVPTPSLLASVTIDHGPEDLLAPVFLRVEYAIRQLGVQLKFRSLRELAATNAVNRDSWAPLFPIYDPTYWGDDGQDTFCLVAEEPNGRAVATLAVRFYDWPTSNLADEAVSLRLFGLSRPAASRCEVSAVGARAVSGKVALAGAVWIHPDWRKHPRLMMLMPRFARALCIARRDIDHYTLLMTEAVYRGGLTRKTGMGNVDWSVDIYGCSMGDLRLALLRMNRTELHDDLSRCLVELGTQVDQRVIAHGADQQFRA